MLEPGSADPSPEASRHRSGRRLRADRQRSVLVLNHFAAPLSEAGGTRHAELFSRLPGWQHHIVAADLNPQSRVRQAPAPGFVFVQVPGYSVNGGRRVLNWVVYAVRAFATGLLLPRPRVVFGSSPHLLAALAAWAVATLRRVPFVLEVRDLWPRVLVEMGQLSADSWAFRLLTRLELFLYARAVAIVVLAAGTREDLLRRGVPARKIHDIPNGADPADFTPSASRDQLRQRFGFAGTTAVYTGAHGPANGLDLLLEAAEGLRDLDLQIVLVGGGVAKAQLVEESRRRGLANVSFRDPVPKSEIPDLLAAADLGLHVLADHALFHSAVSPNKVFDYMAAGLPIVTNCPGLVADVVAGAGAGHAVAARDLGAGIRDLLARSDSERVQMGRSGRAWLEAHQSRSAMVDRLAALLDEVGAR